MGFQIVFCNSCVLKETVIAEQLHHGLPCYVSSLHATVAGRSEWREHLHQTPISDTAFSPNVVSIQQKPKECVWIVNEFVSAFKETVKQWKRLKLLLEIGELTFLIFCPVIFTLCYVLTLSLVSGHNQLINFFWNCVAVTRWKGLCGTWQRTDLVWGFCLPHCFPLPLQWGRQKPWKAGKVQSLPGLYFYLFHTCKPYLQKLRNIFKTTRYS